MNSMVALPIAAVVPVALPAMSPLPGARLFEIEAKIVEHQEAIDALAPEACRLQDIWSGESKRLHMAALRGECKLTSKEQWAAVKAMPEAKEHTRLAELMRPHDEALDELIDQMWAIPAQTPEGKAVKIMVLICSVMGKDWSEHDGEVDVEIRLARALMIELVGGEPAAQLRDQFAA